MSVVADWVDTYHYWLEVQEILEAPLREKFREESWMRRVVVATPEKQDRQSVAPPKVTKRPRG